MVNAIVLFSIFYLSEYWGILFVLISLFCDISLNLLLFLVVFFAKLSIFLTQEFQDL